MRLPWDFQWQLKLLYYHLTCLGIVVQRLTPKPCVSCNCSAVSPQRMAPDATGGTRKLFDHLFKGMREGNEMVDDMFEGMEVRGGLVEEAKGKARVASQEY